MIEIIPAIDIIEGKCVRLTQGDFNLKTIYNEDPLEVAKEFESYGIKRLHLVDLDGAKKKTIVNQKVLEKICSVTNLIVDFGGGIQSTADLKIAFESGASMVTGGSVAVKKEALFISWIETYGPEKIILGSDVLDEKISVSGWQESTEISIYDFLEKYISKGITKTISTDVAKDGLLKGPSIPLYSNIKAKFPSLYLIASGGISCIEDIHVLIDKKIEAVIVGKAIYEKRITLKQLSDLC